MKQLQRVDVYEQFNSKKHATLFATDIASRGLGEVDFFVFITDNIAMHIVR